MTVTTALRSLSAALLLGAAVSAQANPTILTTVPGAENAIQVSDGRMFVSGNDGLYMVSAGSKTKVPIAFDAWSIPSTLNKCYFTGLTQYANVLYAACTPDLNSAFSPRYVLMMDLGQSPQMRAFYKGNDIGFFNGISADTNGTLYLANFGNLAVGSTTKGKIVKMTMSAPGKIATKTDWLSSSGRVNGIRVSGSTVYYVEDNFYFAGTNYMKKVPITATGAAGTPTTIYSSTAYIDDFTLVNGGLVITATTSSPFSTTVTGKLLHLSETGAVLHSATFNNWQITAVAFLKSPTYGSLLVTENKAGNVARFDQAWGLTPR